MDLKGMLVLLLLCILQCTRTDGETPLKFRVTAETLKNGMYYFDTLISSVLVTDYGQLLMADFKRDEIKMVSLKQPNTLLSTYVSYGKPENLLQLLDGRVMVSFRDAKQLVILSGDGDRLTENATLTTERKYSGLALGPSDTVIASSAKDGGHHGRVDVLDLTGKVLRTLLDDTSDSLPGVFYLRRYGDNVYLSEFNNHKVMMANVYSNDGTVQDATFGGLALSSLNLKHPTGVWFDHHGNMYVSVLESHLCEYCVIQISQAGKAKGLPWVMPSESTGHPYGITTTPTLLIVPWWITWAQESEVTAYQLPY